MLSRHHICMGPRRRMLLRGNRQILPLWYVLKMGFADMPGDAWRKPKGATRMRSAFKLIRNWWCFATPSDDIWRPSRHNYSQFKHWHQNCDTHARREAHSSNSRQALYIARIHLLNINIQNVIPTQGGKRILATSNKKCRHMPRPW